MDLREHLGGAEDGTGDHGGEEGDKESVIDDILFALAAAAFEVEKIGGALKDIEAQTHGQENGGQSDGKPENAQKGIEISEQEIRVFEDHKQQKIKDKGKSPYLFPFFLILLLRAPETAQIRHRDACDEHKEIFEVIGAVKYEACDKQDDVLPPCGFPEQPIQQEKRGQQDRPELKAYK